MNRSDFSFLLPVELIAQTPIDKREQSRLLCVDRRTGELNHRHFFELPSLLHENDCLVLNDSRVMQARLLGEREKGGAVEVLLLRRASTSQADGSSVLLHKTDDPSPCLEEWECLVRPGRRAKPGTRLVFGNGELTAVVTGVRSSGNRLIEFQYGGKHGDGPGQEDPSPCAASFDEILERLGKTPLPPYIHEELEDNERYQTVYSRVLGSAAAPTAGLHFTKPLLDELAGRGVKICFITLHVGLGTFRPVRTDAIEEHRMHSEYFTIPEETAETVNHVKSEGGRVIAVGTTSCRALETCTDETGAVSAFAGSTDIFIYPGYGFKCIDGLITNFHLPESTLILLVSAFAGRENILSAYNEAIRKQYRFYSFGDAMMII